MTTASDSSVKSERGAMPQAERAVEIDPLADRKNAGGGDDAVVADDDAAVVQRRFREEDADHQFGRERAIDRHAALGEALDVLLALDGDERAELAVREVEGDLGAAVDRLAASASRKKSRCVPSAARPRRSSG